ncbi:GntR family transcriptional regulator [Bosea sp. BK604]|uniref:GntR family transcriptional regulator n=1 Tax=Bosea sp. BK604 TaxID=2512180 RepID=UPI001044D3E9|nr:GntR family transcriptional regulator [Bosea sp. BK604]TCR70048.1 GntR family transcriptional regulator [Bosea sp. BK604]
MRRIRADTVKDQIRGEIISGALAFGARLRIDELASRYGASHMPIREALRSLAGEGLVVTEANKGARVVTIDERHVAHLFSVRIALEVTLAREAVATIAEADLAEIETLERERLALADEGRFGEAVETNQRFHRRIYEIPGNAEALSVLDRHWLLLAALWSRFGYRPERLGGVASDHDHIIRALRQHDAEACGALTAAHVTKTRQDLIAQMALATKAQA